MLCIYYTLTVLSTMLSTAEPAVLCQNRANNLISPLLVCAQHFNVVLEIATDVWVVLFSVQHFRGMLEASPLLSVATFWYKDDLFSLGGLNLQ